MKFLPDLPNTSLKKIDAVAGQPTALLKALFDYKYTLNIAEILKETESELLKEIYVIN